MFSSSYLFLASTNLFIACKLNISDDDYTDVTRQLIQRNGRDSRRHLRGDRRSSSWNLRVPHSMVTVFRFFPREEIDGQILIDLVFGSQRENYYHLFQRLCCDFVNKIHSLFSTENCHFASIMDVPNLHRLLELAYHSLPKYGHCRLFSDCLFETKHQPLKKHMLRDKHSTNHIHALETDVMEQWKLRVAKTILKLKDSDLTASERRNEEFQLNQLLLGFNTSNRIANGSIETKRRAKNTVEKLQNSLVIPGLLRLEMKNVWIQRSTQNYWKLHSQKQGCIEKVLDGLDIPNGTLSTFRASVQILINDSTSNAFQASSIVLGGKNLEKLMTGQFFCDQRCSKLASANVFYKFLFPIRASNHRVTASCIKTLGNSDASRSTESSVNLFQVIQTQVIDQATQIDKIVLKQYHRKVASFHVCNNLCNVSDQMETNHIPSTSFESNSFYVQSRINGYPPFCG